MAAKIKLLYLHGLHSAPGGFKPRFLAEQGFLVVNPALPDDDFVASVRIAQAAFDESKPDVVVGSSRGGAVAVELEIGETPLVLIAPAWRACGARCRAGKRTVILHSPNDAVIPIADSRELVQRNELDESSLLEIGQAHTMTDPQALAALLAAIRELTKEHRE